MFNGMEEDGIRFEKVAEFLFVGTFAGRQKKFNEWKRKCLKLNTDDMIREYIRLTNISFAVDENLECYKTPPVFLLD